MPIQIAGYQADGPFGNTQPLEHQSGVYVILGRNDQYSNWSVVDVGESQNVRDRVENHDRKPCWRGQGYAEFGVAAIYADHANRMVIERQLRTQFNPPCGLI